MPWIRKWVWEYMWVSVWCDVPSTESHEGGCCSGRAALPFPPAGQRAAVAPAPRAGARAAAAEAARQETSVAATTGTPFLPHPHQIALAKKLRKRYTTKFTRPVRNQSLQMFTFNYFFVIMFT